ncbi:hypothetical protein SAMN04487761_13112 [Lachnospiraceae bacterium C7]|nr:hypothetical protein SAMN04487761_13112 [Lachnospiraceae bacterium C7]
MNLNTINNNCSALAAGQNAVNTNTKKNESKNTSSEKFSDIAAVYEGSTDKTDSSKIYSTTNSKKDTSAIVAQLKADAENRKNQLLSIVKNIISGQGKAIGTADDMWKFLAKGDFTVSPEVKAQAQADIAEDGYWGVEQTSDRILDFAKALSGNDSSKAEMLLDAFKKGFEQATGTWGKELPEISQRTYDAVLEKFDKWANGTE